MKEQFTDEELLEGINNRNKRAMNILCDRIYRKMCLYAQKVVNNTLEKADINDIVIDAFLYTMEYKKAFLSLEHVERIMCNNIKRKAGTFFRKRNSPKHNLPVVYDLSDVSEEDDDLRTHVDVINAINEEIEKLSAENQQLLQWIYFEGLGTAEIAARLNINPQSVINKKGKLLKAIRVILIRKKLLILLLCFFNPN